MPSAPINDPLSTSSELNALLEQYPASPVSPLLMKAQRLARIRNDAGAQTWLAYESNGYPKEFDISVLGTAGRYCMLSRGERDGFAFESSYTFESWVNSEEPMWVRVYRPRLARFRSALHAYALDIYLAAAFGEGASDIFQEARAVADSFLTRLAPKALAGC